MTCTNLGNTIICTNPTYKLRLDDWRRIFVDWHYLYGPTIFKDKYQKRMIEDWHEDPLICKAIDWFAGRGNRL
jgi:hypothetical protein